MKARSVPGSQSMPWTLRWPVVNTSGVTLSERKSRGAQDLAVEPVGPGRARLAGLAGRDVELAVGAEREPAAVVDRAGLDAVDDDRVDGQAVVGEAVARDLVLGGRRQVEVDEAVVGELRVDGDAEQAALRAVGLDDVLDDSRPAPAAACRRSAAGRGPGAR